MNSNLKIYGISVPESLHGPDRVYIIGAESEPKAQEIMRVEQ